MASGRKCDGCGARVKSDGATFCAYCGAELPGIEKEPERPASAYDDLEARFAALKEHSSFPNLMRHRPSTTGTMGPMIAGVVVGGIFLVVSIFIYSQIQGTVSQEFNRPKIKLPGGFGPGPREIDPPPGFEIHSGPSGFDAFTLIPLLFVLIGAGVVIYSIVRIARFRSAPLRRKPALVTGERTRVSGGGNNSSSTTTYYVTLEFESGRRKEYRTVGRVVGRVGEGDIGVAYLKDNHVIDFRRVRV